MKLALLLILSFPLWAQFQPVPSTRYPGLEAILNAKPAAQTGSGAPSGNCTRGKDFYIDTTAKVLYYCSATNGWTKALSPDGSGNVANGAACPGGATNSVCIGGKFVGDGSLLTNLPAASFTGMPIQLSFGLDSPTGSARCAPLSYGVTLTGGVISEGSVPAISSSAVVDLWVSTTYQPTVSNTIIGAGTKPTLSSQTSAAVSITGWTTTVTGSTGTPAWVCAHVDSSTAAQALQLTLFATRN